MRFVTEMHRRAVQIAGLSVLLGVLLVSTATSAERFRLSGYYKNFSTVYDLPDFRGTSPYGGKSIIGSVSNRLRLDAYWEISKSLRVDVSYNIVPRIQDELLFSQDIFAFGINPLSYRFDDIDEILYPEDLSDISSFAVYQNLDRARVHVRLPWADLYLGRQAIAWGSARVINPTDVIAPYAFTELDIENRIGVDAARLRIPIGFMGEVDAGYVAGDDFKFDRSAVFLRGKYYFWRTDVSALLVGFRENLMVGIDFARSVGGAGTWLEAAYVFVGALDGGGVGDDYLRLTAGADYSLSDGVYGFVEYHYNQAESNDAGDYSRELGTTAYREGSVYLLGEHYLIPGVNWQVSALWTATAQTVVNLGDPSFSLNPYVEYNIAENIYLAAGAYIGVGEDPTVEWVGMRPQVSFASEFGAYPALYYSSFRVYF
jgi:hypothetical protein